MERVIIGLLPNLPGIKVQQESRHESHHVFFPMLRLTGRLFPKYGIRELQPPVVQAGVE